MQDMIVNSTRQTDVFDWNRLSETSCNPAIPTKHIVSTRQALYNGLLVLQAAAGPETSLQSAPDPSLALPV